MSTLSVNRLAQALVEDMVAEAAALSVGVQRGTLGERLIDAGANARGGVAAGLAIARICMGGLGHVEVVPDAALAAWPWSVTVRSSQPVLACLGSQYAGWSLSHGSFSALGSGPARALAGKEELFAELGYRDTAAATVLVLEAGAPPPPEIIDMVAAACGVKPAELTVIYAPTQSVAGSLQVTARVLEVALHKAHTLHFPLAHIVDGLASAPIAPPHPDFVTAMGRTNDAIIYGGRVHLFVTGPAAAARELANRLPSRGSRDYGHPFAAVFQRFNGDFYAIDPMLFSPAEAIVTAVEHGLTFRAGGVAPELIAASFS